MEQSLCDVERRESRSRRTEDGSSGDLIVFLHGDRAASAGFPVHCVFQDAQTHLINQSPTRQSQVKGPRKRSSKPMSGPERRRRTSKRSRSSKCQKISSSQSRRNASCTDPRFSHQSRSRRKVSLSLMVVWLKIVLAYTTLQRNGKRLIK